MGVFGLFLTCPFVLWHFSCPLDVICKSTLWCFFWPPALRSLQFKFCIILSEVYTALWCPSAHIWEPVNVEEWKRGCPVLGRTWQECPALLSSQEEALHHHTVVFFPSQRSQRFPRLTWTGERRNPGSIFKAKSPAWWHRFDFFKTSGWRQRKRNWNCFEVIAGLAATMGCRDMWYTMIIGV